jgi:hypothetical protein
MDRFAAGWFQSTRPEGRDTPEMIRAVLSHLFQSTPRRSEQLVSIHAPLGANSYSIIMHQCCG